VTILHASFYGRRRGLFPKRLRLSRSQAPSAQKDRWRCAEAQTPLLFGSPRSRLRLLPPLSARPRVHQQMNPQPTKRRGRQ
jgi:hypothetical protein